MKNFQHVETIIGHFIVVTSTRINESKIQPVFLLKILDLAERQLSNPEQKAYGRKRYAPSASSPGLDACPRLLS